MTSLEFFSNLRLVDLGRHVVRVIKEKEWYTRTTYLVSEIVSSHIILKKVKSQEPWVVMWPLQHQRLNGEYTWVPKDKRLAREQRFRTGNYRKIKQDNNIMSLGPQAPTCRSCLVSLPHYIFRPCMHATYCGECYASMLSMRDKTDSTSCPVCRTQGEHKKMYW